MSMGVQAAQQCDDFGWTPTGTIDPSLVAEVTQQRGYGAGRAWSATASYDLSYAPGRIYLVHTVEGGFDFTVDGDVVVAEAGQLILLDGDAPTAAKTRSTTARFVWHLNPTFLNPRSTRFSFHEPISVNNSTMRALTSMTNAILNAGVPDTAAAQAHFGIALEHLVAGALEETGTLPDDAHAMHRDGLFTTAQLVIESHFRDPAFDVARLARELVASPSRVHSAFSAFGTTPRREIERRRVSEVDRLSAQILTASQVIERAGFTSIRQYKRAISRDPSRRSADEKIF